MGKKLKKKKGQALWERAKKIIPGGNQLLSKRAEMFLPEGWPSYYTKAKGVHVWDLDGKKYIDMSIMSVGACLLGYADQDVNRAVKKAVDGGSISTLNPPEEVELAELFIKIHPWAKMVRYARTGGEAAAVAIRIARAYSGKDKIAFCGYHGWQDWYLSANLAHKKNLDGHLLAGLSAKGVPRGLAGSALPFHYNNIAELESIAARHKDIGAIVMEPIRYAEPAKGFLQNVRRIADEIGAVLIFDEISSGFKVHYGGAHLLYGVNPDIAVFAKAISNGFPMAAIIGKEEVMQAAQESFISSTYWTERVGPAAALATLKKMKEKKIHAHMKKMATLIRSGLKTLADKHELKMNFSGLPTVVVFSFDYGDESQAIRTLFTQEMLVRGFLASNAIYVSYSHSEKDVRAYLKSADEVFVLLKDAVRNNKVKEFLKGPVAHAGFQRLT
ncbi:aminotransferase class III-fold pyridoxal phosphate-dependent enzyme [bacterium]|nr:aminotransferase class III-fold pyridoxal phosphate-dependent enzyme [bacterium]